MSIFAKLKKSAGSVAKFMARYADETSDIADVLRLILPALPIGAQDRNRVVAAIDKLDNVADNIGAFLASNPSVGEPVKIRASDLDAAIVRYFNANPDALSAVVAAEIDKRAVAATLAGES